MLAEVNKLKEELKVSEEKVRINKEEKIRLHDKNDNRVE